MAFTRLGETQNTPLEGWRWLKRGESLFGNYVLALFQVAADLDYLCNYLGLQHFNHGSHPCFRCHANRTTVPHLDLRPTALWRSQLVAVASWYLQDKHLLFADPRVGLNVSTCASMNFIALHSEFCSMCWQSFCR